MQQDNDASVLQEKPSQAKQTEIRILMWANLTYTQAKAYLTLLELGPSATKKIAFASKISQPDVYRIMQRLHELGLVEKIITTPSLFRALPLEEYISSFIEKQNEEKSKILSEMTALRDTHKQYNDLQEEPQFVIVPPKVPLKSKLIQAINSAQESIEVMISSNNFLKEIQFMGEAINKALNRGAYVRVVIDKPKGRKAFLKAIQPWLQFTNFSLRIIPSIPVELVSIDRKKVLIETSEPAGVLESAMIYTNNVSLMTVINKFFEHTWKKSTQCSPKEQKSELIKG